MTTKKDFTKICVQEKSREVQTSVAKKQKVGQAKQKVIDKFYPKYKEMGLAQRVKTDQKIQQK